MTKDEIVKILVEQVVAMGFKIRLITLDAGFYSVDSSISFYSLIT
jgi:putative transposase